MATYLFVGGGSAGHVLPGIAVAEALRTLGPTARTVAVAADRADEIVLLKSHAQPFHTLEAPRFPRHCIVCMLTFPFTFLAALVRAFVIVRRERPCVVFAKGGPTSVPVCLVAWALRIPIVLHCSDTVASMGDRFLSRLAVVTCTGFPDLGLPRERHTGNPVRSLLTSASRDAGCRLTGFSGRRPVILIWGGSQGARHINEAVDAVFDELVAMADIIHITGRGKSIDRRHARYWSSDLVAENLPHLLALADIVVTRAGAGALSELAFLGKPAVVIPLEGVAHDHQRHNAAWFASRDAAVLLRDEELLTTLVPTLQALVADAPRRAKLGHAMHDAVPNAAARVLAQTVLDAAISPA